MCRDRNGQTESARPKRLRPNRPDRNCQTENCQLRGLGAGNFWEIKGILPKFTQTTFMRIFCSCWYYIFLYHVATDLKIENLVLNNPNEKKKARLCKNIVKSQLVLYSWVAASQFWGQGLNFQPQLGPIRNHKPEPGPIPTFIFKARFRPESQIYRVSQSMRNYGVSKNVVYGCSCR